MQPTSDQQQRPLKKGWRKYVSEPILFFLFSSFGFRFLSSQQMFQDKICLNTFNQSAAYCRDFSHAKNDDVKLAALDYYQDINTYRTIIQFFMSNALPLYLFIGGFCDAYPQGRRYALLGIILDGLFQTAVAILNNIYMDWSPWVYIISGLSPVHDFTAITIINSYIIVTTSEEERVSRMMYISILFLLAIANGTYFTGTILDTDMPWVQYFAPKQIHNTLLPLVIGLLFQTGGFVWTYLFITAESMSDDRPIDRKGTDDNGNNINAGDDEKQSGTKEKSILAKLFDPRFFKDSFAVITKERAHNARFYLHLIIAIQVITEFTQIGPMNNMLPIVQLLYKWDPAAYTRYNLIGTLWTPFAMAVLTPLVTKVLKFSDLQVAFVGVFGAFLGHLLVGSIITPVGYFLHIFVGPLGSFSGTGLRTYLSKILPLDEITKLFFIMQLIGSVIPPLGSVVYTAIVKYSKTFYPTLCFHISAFIILIPLCIIIYADLHFRKEDWGEEKKEKEHIDSEESSHLRSSSSSTFHSVDTPSTS